MSFCRIVLTSSMQEKIKYSDPILFEGDTVKDILNLLVDKYPALKESLLDSNKSVRRFVNIFVDGVNIRDLQELSTKIEEGAELRILSAVAGG